MYGRADGMPSFQLTVAVCACIIILTIHIVVASQQVLRYPRLRSHQSWLFGALRTPQCTDRADDWRRCLRPDKFIWQNHRIAASKHVVLLLRGIVTCACSEQTEKRETWTLIRPSRSAHFGFRSMSSSHPGTVFHGMNSIC
jgi:hypothetical protein